MDLSCGHCGFPGPVELVENVVLKRDTINLEDDGPYDLYVHYAVVYRCPACGEPTLCQRSWSNDAEEWFDERRVYPTIRDNSAVPAKVRQRIDAALRVKKIEPDFYAVGIRRMLETVCNEEGAVGKDLFDKLDDLAAKSRIPGTLAEAAHELRQIGKSRCARHGCCGSARGRACDRGPCRRNP